MAKIPSSELKAMLASARSSALGADTASTLADERKKALDYYYGDMSEDLPSATGRSSAVSTDVCDTVEGLMPALMEIFAGGDEVVKFEPVGPEDVTAAEQETDYINHVFLQQNQGFLVLYNFIKDALLSKNGFVKIFWDEQEKEERETYLDQPEDAFALIAAAAQAGEVEIVEHTPNPETQLHDVTIVTTKKQECAKVEGVPPEEFGIERNARTIRDCNYCYHEVRKTQADLIGQGFDAAQIRKLPSYPAVGNSEAMARDTVEESPDNANGDDGINKSTRLIRVTEHYIRMDYEGGGKACLYRVTTGGEESEVLKRDGKPDIEQVDAIPFASMSPIIVPHRFFGRSVADLVMDIQRIKTALLRGALDNIYLGNNPRPEISESHASDNTLDDLLVSRFGAPIRVKQPGGLFYQQIPSNAANVYPALEYFDQVRESRSGVAKQGQALDSKALLDQSATAANLAYTASQARMKLIARIMAETGIRDLFALLHATIRKHGSKAQTVRLKNQWVTVDPRDWKARNDMTIQVGLGSGGKAEQIAETQMLMSAQEKGMALGLVSKNNAYNTAKRLVRVLGEKDVDAFFTSPAQAQKQDPNSPPDPNAQPIEPPQDPKVAELALKEKELQYKGQEIQTKAQIDQMADERKAQIEQVQAQADIATQDRKAQTELAIAERKFELERDLKLMDFQLKREAQQADLEMKRELHQHAMKQSEFGLVAGAQQHAQKMEQAKAKPQKDAR